MHNTPYMPAHMEYTILFNSSVFLRTDQIWLFEGRISCFRPVTFLDRAGVTQIRPLIYAGEQKIANVAQALALPVVENPCPQDRTSKRWEIKQLLSGMSADYPDMKSKIFGAMQRLPLEGWAPAPNIHDIRNAAGS